MIPADVDAWTMGRVGVAVAVTVTAFAVANACAAIVADDDGLVGMLYRCRYGGGLCGRSQRSYWDLQRCGRDGTRCSGVNDVGVVGMLHRCRYGGRLGGLERDNGGR